MLWMFALALADGPDPAKVCASTDMVVLAPSLHRRFRASAPCTSVVSSESVAQFMKAFAVYERELSAPETAGQLLRTVQARWLLLGDGRSFLVYDGQSESFVDPAVFAPGDAPSEAASPAETAYRNGYAALRAKRADEAREQLTTCLTLDPEHVGCHWELGWVHWLAEDWAAAAASWSAVQQRAPEHPEVGTWLPKARAKAATP
jgi:tetratricopeptide (TPR) repeat protein